MDKTRKHRVAVVGCGALAQFVHLPNIAENPRLELAVTCDLDVQTSEMCRDRFGAERAETDWHQVVNADDVDLIVLATHTNLRGELIIPAVRAGKPVYTEKPLGTDRNEMTAIVRASQETSVPVCVGHNRRSSPAVLEFRRLLEKAKSGVKTARPSIDRRGDAGKRLPEENQLQILMRINDDARSWKDWIFSDQEGIMFAEMVHFIDLALWLNDGHPVRVFAEGSPRGNFTLIIRFSDGSITTLHHTMVGNFDYPKELFEATVDNASVAMDHHIEVRQLGLPDEPVIQVFPYDKACDWAKESGSTGYLRSVEAEQRRALAAGEPARFLNVCKGHYAHLDRFVDHIEGSGENPCSVESAVIVNTLAVKFLESARLGIPITIVPD